MAETGVHCYECMQDYPGSSECPIHADELVVEIRITPCTVGEACEDDSHDFGLNAHVVQVDD